MIFYMLSDKNGNLIFVGTPQIRIPEKMFFLAKNGQVREAPTTTKTGALSMRGGVRSISLIPDGDKVEIVKLGETLEEFRKRQSKKESEDFIKKVNETKINKKLDIGNMPELPEPKKEKKIKKPEPEPEPTKQNDITLDDFKSVEFLREGIDLYYRDKDQHLTNLQKFNMEKLKNIVIKRKINLDELVNFYNLGIKNMIEMYKDSNSDKIKKLRKKWNASIIITNKKKVTEPEPELPEPKKENKVSNLIDDYLKVKDYVGLLNNKTINFNDKMKVLKDLSFKELQNLTFHKLSEFVKFKDLKFGDICLVYLINKKALAYCVKKTAKTATFERIKFLEHDFIKSNEFNVDGIRDWGRDENYYYIDKPSVYSNKVYTIRFSEDDGLYVYNNPCVIKMIGETHKTY